jgi:hypothetical protein
MKLHDECLTQVGWDIFILREELDNVANQPDPDRARRFLRHELLSSQQMYCALLKNRRRQLVVGA